MNVNNIIFTCLGIERKNQKLQNPKNIKTTDAKYIPSRKNQTRIVWNWIETNSFQPWKLKQITREIIQFEREIMYELKSYMYVPMVPEASLPP